MPTVITPQLSRKLRLIALLCTVLVCFNHASTLLVAPPPDSGQDGLLAACLAQFLIADGLSHISTPFFFLVAGFFLFASPTPLPMRWVDETGMRVRSLAMPYLIWSGLGLLLLSAIQLATGRDHVLGVDWLGNSPSAWLSAWLFGAANAPLWFLRVLGTLILLSPLVWLVLRHRRNGLVLVGVTAVMWYAFATNNGFAPLLPTAWTPELWSRGLFFFCAGAWIAVHRPRLPPTGTALRWVSLGVWLGLAAAIAWQRAGGAEDAPAWLNHPCILAGIVATWTWYDRWAEQLSQPLLVALGSSTFFVYIAHEPAAAVMANMLPSLLGRGASGATAAWLIAGTISAAGGLACAAGLQLYAPRLWTIVAGGQRGGFFRQPARTA